MSKSIKNIPVISVQALKRMPSYLEYLKRLRDEKTEFISAAKTSEYFQLSEIQVRKDFAAVSNTGGKPKTGFSVAELIDNIEDYLGVHNSNEAVLAGVGSLGNALLSYGGFESYGIKITAAFDNNKEKVGGKVNGVAVLSSEKISSVCRRMNIHIGIITAPENQAQLICDQFVAGGVKAIWNFAPTHLSVPEGVLLQNENMAVSLAMLSKHLQDVLYKEG